jgi:hypothetical protein
MRRAAVLLTYVAATIAARLYLDAIAGLVFSAVAALLFAVAYLVWASGSRVVVVAAVLVLTIVFPVIFLVLIRPPGDLALEAFAKILSASRESGPLRGLEWLVPLLSASVGVTLTRYSQSVRRSPT